MLAGVLIFLSLIESADRLRSDVLASLSPTVSGFVNGFRSRKATDLLFYL